MPRPNPPLPSPGPPDSWPRREDALARLRDALQLLPLAEEVVGQPGTHLRVLFQPTFHPPGCLTLHLQDQASTVEVVLCGTTGRDGVREESSQQDQSPPPSSRRADLYWAAASVPAAALEQFRSAVAGIALADLGDTQAGNGRDGMLIDGEVVEDGVVSTFAAWSPTATGEPAAYQVCLALLDLGRACLLDAPSQLGLGQIQRYLHQR